MQPPRLRRRLVLAGVAGILIVVLLFLVFSTANETHDTALLVRSRDQAVGGIIEFNRAELQGFDARLPAAFDDARDLKRGGFPIEPDEWKRLRYAMQLDIHQTVRFEGQFYSVGLIGN